VGLRSCLDECGKIRCGIRSPDRPTSSEFLYQLRYSGPQGDTISEFKMPVVCHTLNRSFIIKST